MQLAVFTGDFGFMQRNATFIPADGAEEVESMNPCILLDNELFFTAIVEAIPEDTFESMPLQLICFGIGDGGLRRFCEVDTGFIPTSWRIRQMDDFFTSESAGYLVDRNEEDLAVSQKIIIIIAMQPEHREADAVIDPGYGADVQEISFSAAAFSIITELVLQSSFAEKEPLRTTVFLIEGLKRDEGIAVEQSDGDGIREDIHGVNSFLYVKGSTLQHCPSGQ